MGSVKVQPTRLDLSNDVEEAYFEASVVSRHRREDA